MNSIPLSDTLHQVSSNFNQVIRSEIKLARVEIKETANRALSDSLGIALGAGILAAGLLPFIAFLVMGLGKLMGDQYWASSLIVAVVFLTVGSILTLAAVKRFTSEDLSLPEARDAMEQQVQAFGAKVQQIKDAAKRKTL
jgi:uncharacterized membrane protein YqjE